MAHLKNSNIFPVIKNPPLMLMKESSVVIAPIQCDGVSGIKLDPLFPWANNNIPPSAVIPEMAFVTVTDILLEFMLTKYRKL